MASKFRGTANVKPLPVSLAKVQARLTQGVALHKQGLLEHAKQIYEEVLKSNPRHFDALHLLGLIAHQSKHYQKAADLISKAIEINPKSAAAYSNLGNTFSELKQFDAAIMSYGKAVSLKPNYTEAYYNRGLILMRLGLLEASLQSFNKAISLKPNYAEAYSNRGNCLKALKKFDEAIQSYNKAISLKPDYAEAYSNRGAAFKELNQLEAAIENYNKATFLNCEFAEAYLNQGEIFKELSQFAAAVKCYEKALVLRPELDNVEGMLMHSRMHICDWSNFVNRVIELTQKVQFGAKVIMPFQTLSLTGSMPVQRQAAEIYSQDKYPAAAKPVWSGQRYEHARIRVAYVSCDFKLHPAALNNIGMWERHDRDKFELIAISYGPVFQEDATPQGQMRTRLVKAFDRFLDVGDRSDEQIARLMREMEVDIALDLSGTMQGSRQGIFAHRPAPVQVNLYGYTSGSSYMDYMLSDRVVIPPESQWGYTEKVVYMPTAWLANDPTREVSERQFKRSEMGLPEVGVVYCSFNNAYKMNPQMFDVWMRILQQVPGSVLWLQGSGQDKVKENLRKEASVRGVDPARLVFADKIESMAEHLARHRLADVFLDTLPFNAQTTAVDALWAGLPVLTCMGEGVIARMAGSVLMALGLEELVSKDWPEYEAHAVRIGLEAGYAKSLKEKLERNRKDSPLFDTKRLTRNMERAYEQMHERVQQGLGPQVLEVGPSDGA